MYLSLIRFYGPELSPLNTCAKYPLRIVVSNATTKLAVPGLIPSPSPSWFIHLQPPKTACSPNNAWRLINNLFVIQATIPRHLPDIQPSATSSSAGPSAFLTSTQPDSSDLWMTGCSWGVVLSTMFQLSNRLRSGWRWSLALGFAFLGPF